MMHYILDGHTPVAVELMTWAKFETMIFGGEHDQYQDRCSTWEQAEAMHAKALAMVKP